MPSTETVTGQHGLKRELSLRDLVLLQVLLVVGLAWIGTAAEQGSTHVLLWLAGIVFFYLPLATVVILLGRAIPVEGGTYQWVKAGISPFAGYMAAWNMSFYTIVILGVIGPPLVNSFVYMAGPGRAWMMTSTRIIIGVAVAALLLIFGLNVVGFHVGKWVTGGGSVLTLLTAALAVFLFVRLWMSGMPMAHRPFSLAAPRFHFLR